MADIVVAVDFGLPPGKRYINLDQSEVSNGDVIRVLESMGRPADTVTIETAAGSDLEIVLNSNYKKHPRRQYPSDHPYPWAQFGYEDISAEVDYQSGLDRIEIGDASAAVTYSINDVLVDNLQVFFSTGDFTILFS